jgi:aminoglycoside phosphotransferase (APT) family kinase protein
VTVDTRIEDSLLQVLHDATAIPDLAYAKPPRPLTGGFWAELLAFSLETPPPGWPSELVARLMPDAGQARKETIIQAAVALSGFATPAVRASGGPDSGLGRAYMVMDRAPGAPLLSGLTGLGAVTSAVGALRRIPDLLAVSMANLHALDIRQIRDQLSTVSEVPVTMTGMLTALRETADNYERADLAAAAQWLLDHPPAPTPEVLCHGDLHPFNLLVGDHRVTVLDWTAALIAPRTYDVAFTSLLLAEPPLILPRVLRPAASAIGTGLARRFLAQYHRKAAVTIPGDDVRWHQGVVSLRALVEAAGWAQQGILDDRAGHPWLVLGPSFADRLSALTGSAVGLPPAS